MTIQATVTQHPAAANMFTVIVPGEKNPVIEKIAAKLADSPSGDIGDRGYAIVPDMNTEKDTPGIKRADGSSTITVMAMREQDLAQVKADVQRAIGSIMSGKSKNKNPLVVVIDDIANAVKSKLRTEAKLPYFSIPLEMTEAMVRDEQAISFAIKNAETIGNAMSILDAGGIQKTIKVPLLSIEVLTISDDGKVVLSIAMPRGEGAEKRNTAMTHVKGHLEQKGYQFDQEASVENDRSIIFQTKLPKGTDGKQFVSDICDVAKTYVEFGSKQHATARNLA